MAATTTTLDGAVSAQATTVKLTAYTNPSHPYGTPIMLLVGGTEQMRMLSVAGRVLSVMRGQAGTSALAHSTGATVSYGASQDIAGLGSDVGVTQPAALVDSATVTWDTSVTGQVTATSSGGTSILHQATVTIANPQIKTLPSTGVIVVTAQGANLVIIPVAGSVIVNTAAGAYTADTDASWVLAYPGFGYATIPTSVAAELNGAGIELVGFGVGDVEVGQPGTAFDGQPVIPGGRPLTQYANLDLIIIDDYAGVANYTGGNAANTLIVSVVYVVLNTSTGAFV